MPEETSKYLGEVIAHFNTLVDDEERQLLVANVMEEIAGKQGSCVVVSVRERERESSADHLSLACDAVGLPLLAAFYLLDG